jgi:hypothetical protein
MTVREAPVEVGQATARYKGVDFGDVLLPLV